MIVFRSLRWRLQSYYACLLLLALGILTAFSIHWMRVSERHHYDSLLRESRHTLIPLLRSPELVDPNHWKHFESLPTNNDSLRGPGRMRGPGGPPDGGPPGGGSRRGPPTPSTEGVDELLENNWFFGAIAYDGTAIRLSRTYPENILFDIPQEERKGDILTDSGEYRILLHREPWGAVTVIGYSKAWLAADMWSRQWVIVVASLSIFIVATGLGWLLIGRSLRPIRAIRKTADQITDGELSARIENTSLKEDELGELSANLNETFAQFEAMFERQKRFTSEASHELRTPITVILGYCQIALEEDRSPEQIQDAIQACRRAGIRMKNLTNDLLELARLESGEVEFDFSECAIRDVAEEALELIEPLAAEKGVVLREEITDATITANSDRLWQVLVNLLSNAIRHTPEGKAITLRTAANETDLEISIMDEGEGIPDEDLPHIFDRFYRVDTSRNRKTGGSGLGLAISETIVKAHDGSIEARSQVGRGTTFLIRLPL